MNLTRENSVAPLAQARPNIISLLPPFWAALGQMFAEFWNGGDVPNKLKFGTTPKTDKSENPGRLQNGIGSKADDFWDHVRIIC